ncbi:hypothetical protein RV18_GL003194 [Enterococcus termitis]|nr:hypothetical protein RV18_GL003194 [Enterococcus termitis]
MEAILVTLLVLNPLTSNSVRTLQLLNMKAILVTSLVLNPLRSNSVKLLQLTNIRSIVVTSLVLSPLKSNSVRALQPKNICCVFVSKLVECLTSLNNTFFRFFNPSKADVIDVTLVRVATPKSIVSTFSYFIKNLLKSPLKSDCENTIDLILNAYCAQA